jgi:hypothetical protein
MPTTRAYGTGPKSANSHQSANSNSERPAGKKNHKPPFNWAVAKAKWTPVRSEELGLERGLYPTIFEWARDRNWLGFSFCEHYGRECIAFPVTDSTSHIFAAQCRNPKRNSNGKIDWRYEPKLDDQSARPMVFGDLAVAKIAYLLESHLDALALIERAELRDEIDAGQIVVVSTRGATMVNKLGELAWPEGIKFYAIAQNDEDGQKWLTGVLHFLSAEEPVVVPVPKEFKGAAIKDIGDWVKAGATTQEILAAIAAAKKAEPEEEKTPLLELYTPEQVRNYVVPAGFNMVGDYHITPGGVVVLAGPPGVGKSRAGTALAVCGAGIYPWFGYSVHRQFKTLIIQNENGRVRLQREYSDLGPAIDDWVLVSAPPPKGLAFTDKAFRKQLRRVIDSFQPDIIILDPWNSVARDDRAKDYLEAFQAIREVIPTGDHAPTIFVVAHTRKPRPDERANGRALLNLVVGSYVLGAVPRAVFVLQNATDDVTDERVVMTCCKNNDGQLGSRSAWRRRNGPFDEIKDFDWSGFDSHGKTDKDKWRNVPLVLLDLGGNATKAALADALIKEEQINQSTAYRWIDRAASFGLIRFNKKLRVFYVPGAEP